MITPEKIKSLKGKRKLTMLTAYDYPTAVILSRAGVDMILVGDSLGMVVLGYKDTKSVSLADTIRHTAAVVRGSKGSLVIADMPLNTTDTAGMAVRNCHAVMHQTGCGAVKVEGDAHIVEALVNADIPVMAHTGLKPQTADKYRLSGKLEKEAKLIFEEALALERAGAFVLVLECVPWSLAKKITAKVKIPTIGIGAGIHCDGQVMVVSDMIGLFEDFKPKFVRRYANVAGEIKEAAKQYIKDVKAGDFPAERESYK